MRWVPRFGKAMGLSQDREGSEWMDVVIRIYLQYPSVETTDFLWRWQDYIQKRKMGWSYLTLGSVEVKYASQIFLHTSTKSLER